MNKRLTVLMFFMCIGFTAIAQKNINNYKYVIIPLKYEFLDENNQYRLNTLTRYLFKQRGFEALFDEEEFPEELNKDRCKALFANVEKAKGGLFTTKVEITLKDCFGKELFRTETGSSREKDFQKAYTEAIKKAFSSLDLIDYEYQPLEEKVEKEDSVIESAVDINEVETKTEEVETSTEVVEVKTQTTNTTLYAQEKSYGYQVVDATPKVVMQLFKTSAVDVFIVKGRNAIVYKEDGFWYYSENDGELKEPKTLDIKF